MNSPTTAPDNSASSTSLTLVPPQPVATITEAEAASLVQVDPATSSKIDAMVSGYVKSLASLDPHSTDFANKVNAIHQMGNDEIRQSASVSNRLLDKPVKAVESGPFSKGATVSKSLVDLRHTVEDLDPSQQGLLSPKHLFGLIPFGNRLRDYFARYQSAQGHLNAIIQALYHGQDELRQDNAAIEQEKVNVWDIKGKLEQYIYLAGKLDAALEAQIDQIGQTDPERAKALREDVLFYVRQKRQDLLTQLAVNAQGYLALELVRKNNLELIKGVDRATTTTVSALRTAVIVAQALTNQKLVLSQITALNTTTGNMIEATSQMLKDQSGQIHEQAASATISVEKLQAAFANIYATMDMIDAYKLQALDSMQKTIDALTEEVNKSQSYLQRARNAPATETAGATSGRGELALQTPGVRS
ncbi:MAG TPA: toxic anion resistance protein [Candidatus Dormibacteraeota bacterium]|nr:toxic anion resistance protein [Candidatus Dormibacteraeota bacterium]